MRLRPVLFAVSLVSVPLSTAGCTQPNTFSQESDLQQHHDTVRNALGTRFSESAYNRMILELAGASTRVLDRRVQAFIDAQK
jgi:hypothetical protein